MLQDFNASTIDIFNPTGNLLLQSIVGDVILDSDFVEVGFSGVAGNIALQSKLGAVNVLGSFLSANSTANGSIFINAGTNVDITSGRGSAALNANIGTNGTLQISARGDVTVDSNSTLQATHQNIFAGGTLTAEQCGHQLRRE